MNAQMFKRWLVAFALALTTAGPCYDPQSLSLVAVIHAAVTTVTLDTTKPIKEITAPATGWSFRNHVMPV